MRTIRPWQLFEKLTEDYIVQLPMPKHHGIAGISMLETFCLISAMRTVKAQRVLEIGTFRGVTALSLAVNLPEGGHVWTVDLPVGAALPKADESQERFALDRSVAMQRPADVVFTGTPYESRITRVLKDSNTWYPNLDFDFVFIDGGHDYATVASDTGFALAHRAKAIFWHDYGNPVNLDVTAFVDTLVRPDVFHVGDTQLAGLFIH